MLIWAGTSSSGAEWTRLDSFFISLEVSLLSKVFSSAVLGIDGYLVDVEVDLARGLPSFTIVGLPEAAVKESKERVKAAIVNSGYLFPDDRITVNLAPANIRKEGTGFDLPISMGILAATRVVPQQQLLNYLVIGELSLDGQIKPVHGSLSIALAARAAGCKGIILPYPNRREASVVEGIEVIGIKTLSEVVSFLHGGLHITPPKANLEALFHPWDDQDLDFAEVKGQELAKRALEIAAAGGHNLMMIGPPGSGKTMLAKRLPTILPPFTFEEALETTKIYSVIGLLQENRPIVTRRPFRSPHHTISDAGLVGGGHVPRPGEVSLAHNGVLFLDEMPEFKKHVLEVLRQPLEQQTVTISRAATTLTYPAGFMLVAAMNPCPCGYLSDPKHECRCSVRQIQRYRSKVSGPMLDRIDLHVDVPAVPYKDLLNRRSGESSRQINERIAGARRIQGVRFARSVIRCNAQMNSRQIKHFCRFDGPIASMLETAVDKLGLSARAFNRILKIARTIADLAGVDDIQLDHVTEAIQYRSLDRRIGYP